LFHESLGQGGRRQRSSTTSISSALQCAAVRCSVLQCDVVCGSVLSCVTEVSIYDLAEDVVKVVGASVPVGAGYLI